MNYAAKLYITEKELIERLGFDPEITVLTKVDFDSERGDIELFFRSSQQQENCVKSDGQCVRRQKL